MLQSIAFLLSSIVFLLMYGTINRPALQDHELVQIQHCALKDNLYWEVDGNASEMTFEIHFSSFCLMFQDYIKDKYDCVIIYYVGS